MTCPDCQGPVDVVCMHGAAIRCGCGKTIVTTPPRPAPPVHADLRSLIAVLREGGVSEYRAGDVVLVLSPNQWTQPPVPKAEPDENCTCGHALHDHNQSGCVLGCDLAACGRAEEAT